MKCGSCGSGWVEWQGPLTALTHTLCKMCGAVNAHIEDEDEPEIDEGYRDALIDWPGIENEARMVEATFDSEFGEGFIIGRIVKVDDIDDGGELETPSTLPLWHIVTWGGEVSWLDVIEFRYVSEPQRHIIQ